MYYPCSENKGADQLIYAFVFTNADCWFSHAAAHICLLLVASDTQSLQYPKNLEFEKKSWNISIVSIYKIFILVACDGASCLLLGPQWFNWWFSSAHIFSDVFGAQRSPSPGSFLYL